MLENFAVRCALVGLAGGIVGCSETQPCMWLLGSVSPLEEGAALGKVGKLLILRLEDHTLFSMGISSSQCISSPK